MTIHIELTPEVEADLAAQAAKSGVPVDQYVRTVLEQYVAPREFQALTITPAERAKVFRDWVQRFPYRRSEPLPDEAIAR